MKIYLDGNLLVKSQEFEDEIEEGRKRKNSGDNTESRGYNIYTWGSTKEVRLDAFEDEISIDDQRSIMVRLERINCDEFLFPGLKNPEHVISLCSYNSFIPIYERSALEIIGQLERRGVDCILGTTSGPIMNHKRYISKRLKQLLEDPIKEVEL